MLLTWGKNSHLKNLPNVLSWMRLVLSPFLIIPIFTDNKYQFFYMFVTLGLTDVLDGLIARKLSLTSEYGRKIDSYADYVWAGLGAVAFILFFGQEAFRSTPIFILIAVSYLIPLIIALVKLKSIPQLHLVTNKISGVVFSVICLTFLLIGYNSKLMWVITFSILLAGIDRSFFYLFLRNRNDYELSSSLQLIKKIKSARKQNSGSSI